MYNPFIFGQRILVKNVSFLFWGQLASKIVLMGTMILLARGLQPTLFGDYVLISTISLFMGVVGEFGLYPLTIRELSKNHEQQAFLFTHTIIIKTLLFPCLIATGLLFLHAFAASMQTRMGLVIMGINSMCLGWFACGSAVARSYERMEIEVVSLLMGQSLSLVLVALSLEVKLGFLGCLGAILVGGIISTFLCLVWIRKAFGPLFDYPDLSKIVHLTASGIPFLFSSILSQLYFRVDVFLLKIFSGSIELGIYGAAYKIFEGLTIVPSSLAGALYPRLSKEVAQNPTLVWVTLRKGLILATAIAITFTLFCIFLSKPILPLLFGPRFLTSSVILIVLSLALVFVFNNHLLGITLYATGHQKYWMKLAALAFAFNIASNLFVIPRFAGVGAATTTVLTEIILFVGAVIGIVSVVRKHTTLIANNIV